MTTKKACETKKILQKKISEMKEDEYKEDGLKRQLSIGATLRDILETSAPQTANGALIVLRDIVHQIRKDAQDEPQPNRPARRQWQQIQQH